MFTQRFIAGLAAASLTLASVPNIALMADADSSSSSSSASSTDARTSVREQRCARFAKGDDYERCVRLIKRLPARETSSASSKSADDTASGYESDENWKWTNILNRIEEKLGSTVKFVGTMAKKFCMDRTDDNEATSRACMTRIKNELKTRIDRLLDETFRAALPSSR